MSLSTVSTVSLACLSMAAALPAAPVEAPKPAALVTLRYQFQDGETVRYQIDQQATLMALKGEVREKTFSRSRTEQRLKVVSVDSEGVATLRLSIDEARMEYAFNDVKPTVFDSRKKTLPKGVARAIDRPLAEIQVRPEGTVAAIEPLLSQAELAEVPGKLGLDGEAASTLFVKLPDEPAAIGHEWHDIAAVKVSISRELTQEVKILKQYRLERVEDGIAVIDMKSSVMTPVTEPSMLVQLIQRTSTGTIRFDVAAGRIVDWKVDVDNTEIGWHGPDSSLRAVSTWNERLIGEPTSVSLR